MLSDQSEYLFARASDEVERLSFWAQVWEPEVEAMIDQIPIQAGWQCIDLGCGPRGILGSLARRVGPTGAAVGVDTNPAQLAAAGEFARAKGYANVSLIRGDAYATGLPRASFDLVHARFMLTPLGREEALLEEMVALARPGGIVALQESDSSSYVSDPPQPAWDRLRELTVAAFARTGGNYDSGRHLYAILRRAGLENIYVRAAVLALPHGHPFRRWPLQSAAAMRPRMIEWGLTTEAELESLLAAGEAIADNDSIFLLSFMVVQAWGQKRNRAAIARTLDRSE
jgi:ubiquinone/menaquinone biosynthesis C-methylase UbiE